MGIFNEETLEEKNFKRLIKNIKSAKLPSDISNYLVNFVTEIKDKKRNNSFFDFDFLEAVMLEVITTEFEGYEEFIDIFNQIIEKVKFFIPAGISTPDYDVLKRMFIQNFSSGSGFIAKGIFDEKFYTLFDSRLDYLYLMNLISSDEFLVDNFDAILSYACEVSPFCINQDVLKNEILSFINGLEDELDDIDSYIEEKLKEAKKRSGVYPGLDEKTLALISAEAEAAQAYIVKLDSLQKKVDNYEDRIASLAKSGRQEVETAVRTGKKEIADYSDSAIAKMKQDIEATRQELVRKLDEYLLTLEEALKKNSDEVFSKILLDTQEKVNEIKLAAQSLSSTTSADLLRISNATQESVEKLRRYVETEPQLQQFLKSAADNEQIMEALKKFSEIQTGAATQTVVATPASGILIPGNERVVVPASPQVIIPKEQSQSIVIPAFDESIPFDVRMERILREKERREAQGEFFHEMVEEVIRCVIEGDWVYLWGPSGCGKSYVIKQVAELIGIDLIENGKITEKHSIMAYNDPHGRFRATQAFVALVYGKLLSLDEFDNGNVDTQVVLNELYSGLLNVLEKPGKPSYVTFAEDMTVPINPNFRMISAGNTKGGGEDESFSSRGKIDEAVQERQTPKRFYYDNRVEKRIFGSYEAWYKVFIRFREACEAYAKTKGWDVAPGITTTRDASAIVKYIGHNSKTVDQIMREKFTQTKDAEYLTSLRKFFCGKYGINADDLTDLRVPKKLRDADEMVLAKSLVYACNQSLSGNGKRRGR